MASKLHISNGFWQILQEMKYLYLMLRTRIMKLKLLMLKVFGGGGPGTAAQGSDTINLNLQAKNGALNSLIHPEHLHQTLMLLPLMRILFTVTSTDRAITFPMLLIHLMVGNYRYIN